MGAIKDAFLDVAQAADNMGESAEKVGVSVEFLSGVGYAAKDAGASVEELADGMKFLQRNTADAAAGNDAALKSFADLGVNFEDSTGKIRKGEAIFYDVADAISRLPTEAQKTKAAMDLMGRGGTELIPTLNMGSAGIKAMQADAERLGAVMTTKLSEAGDKWGKLETTATEAWDGVKQTLATPVLEFIGAHFEELKGIIIDVAATVRSSLEAIDWESLLNDGLQLFKHLGETIKGIDWGSAVQGILTIADALIKVGEIVLKTIEGIGKLNDGIKSLTGGKLGLLSVLLPSVPALGSALTGGSGGGNRSSSTTEIKQLTVEVPGVDVNSASSAIAGKMQAPLRDALGKQKSRLESRTATQFTARSL